MNSTSRSILTASAAVLCPFTVPGKVASRGDRADLADRRWRKNPFTRHDP